MQLLQPSFTHFWWHRSDGERVDAGGDRHAPFGDIVPERPDLRLRVRELGDPHDCAMRSSSPLIRVSTGTIRVIFELLSREGPLMVVAQYTGPRLLASPRRPLGKRVHVGQAVPIRCLRLGGRGSDNQDRRQGGASRLRDGLLHAGASRISRTLPVKVAAVKGFWRNSISGSSTPRCATA